MLHRITTAEPDSRQNERIAALNDAARASMGITCRLILDKAIYALPDTDLARIIQRIATWSEWDRTWNGDAESLRNNGRFVSDNGMDIFWEIYADDRMTRRPSSDPTDAEVTLRSVSVQLFSDDERADEPRPDVVIGPNFGRSRR